MKIDAVTIIRIVLVGMGVLLFFNLLILFRVSNPSLGFTVQGFLALFLIAYGIFLHKIPKTINIIVGILALIPLTLALFLFVYGNVSDADYTEDVVIVLGAGLRGESVGGPLARRLDASIAYFHQNPEAYIIVTGGLGVGAPITEAEAMFRYLTERGIPEERILKEDKSTSTYENLLFAKEILDQQFPEGYSSVLITNDFHIYRAVRTANQVGLEVSRIGAYTAWYTWPVNYLRETLAVLNLWFPLL